MTTEQSVNPKLTEKEFVIKAIKTLRKPPYLGIHCVYSNLNNAFRTYFLKDPIPTYKALEADGTILTKPVKGGVMLYLAEEVPYIETPEDTIKKILKD